METIILGRSGLRATVAGLGCGGFSRIGVGKFGLDHAAGIVRAAYDSGVNFFDTATAYGTQAAVGKGLEGISRDRYILSTKFPYRNKTAADLGAALEESLRELKTDYIDIYHLHGVAPADYPEVRDTFVPLMEKAKREGKIRHLGITEVFGLDTGHAMFQLALPDDIFDVIMSGYNILNPSAAKRVLPAAIEHNVGVLCMFAVRQALHDPAQLKKDIAKILENGQADPALVKDEGVLDFLVESGAAGSVVEAAYRFCRHTPGIGVVLTGTGNADHLRENTDSIQKGPLPSGILEKLEALFGGVDCVSGQ
ncbi:MAG: aldo/keto reductase [Treponema sp.]|jgi:aryl-alcohol dehydrogenase-like predicted oxidoreductase|nr:aldo/keto reductase [Treponema sp.]